MFNICCTEGSQDQVSTCDGLVKRMRKLPPNPVGISKGITLHHTALHQKEKCLSYSSSYFSLHFTVTAQSSIVPIFLSVILLFPFLFPEFQEFFCSHCCFLCVPLCHYIYLHACNFLHKLWLTLISKLATL